MGFILSPFAGLIWDRKELRETEPPPQLVSAKVTETAAGDESVGIRPLGGEMSGAAGATRGVGHFIRIGLGVIDELTRGLDAFRRGNDQHQRDCRDRADGENRMRC